MISTSPNPRAQTLPHPTPRLGLNLDHGRRSPPRPTPGLGLHLARPQGSGSTSTTEDDLHLARPQVSDSTSTSDDSLRLARPQGSDPTSTSNDGLRLARPQGSDSASTSEEPPPRLTLGSDRPRRWGAHHYPTPSWLRLQGTRPVSHLARPGKTSNDGTPRAP
jgi:hypothetical protein